MELETIEPSDYERIEIHSRLNCFKAPRKLENDFSSEISHGLTQNQKFIPPKFFYDKKGSELFEQISNLPEYYLTCCEIEILNKIKADFHKIIEGDLRLVELGSGSANKTRLILDTLSANQNHVEYVPIDISDIVKESSKELLKDYDNLHITAIIDTYERGLDLIKQDKTKRNLIMFLGSSIGNFSPQEGSRFLEKIYSAMNQNDLFLLGVDLVKDKNVLEAAYNDSQDITAKFNLNLLNRINTELDGNFDTEKFSHYAFYNEEKQRIEIYLKSLEKQTVKIPKAKLTVKLEKDELIHTEHSHKYSIPQLKLLMEQLGFAIVSVWQDNSQNFAVILSIKN